MRYYGTIIRWNEDRGFGAVCVDNTQIEVFAQISAFATPLELPSEGQRVSFEIEKGRRGRDEARNICLAAEGEGRQPPAEEDDIEDADSKKSGIIPALLIGFCIVGAAGYFGFQYWQEAHSEAIAARNRLIVDEVHEKITAERKAWQDAVEGKTQKTKPARVPPAENSASEPVGAQ
ncbi:cold-shock protein [Neisseria chenwenguii]|uniref:Cold-shock protein n=1 Tax=Neisseria chenwenguii TaxID=1853278 RepID=A0A220RZ48_9NEIS|nr:cold shock domain-containing protein [Neisseria chenwenguii]ASK26447.1 cold-shock protein [Neisseria chenwenguii]ROV53861.1 cold shock domain-containing protein [Neisseria chenwenguii]